MGSLLQPNERISLLEEHSIERERRYADRIKTLLLHDDGMSYEEIARVLFLAETTIRRYIKTYQESGLDHLLDDEWKGAERRLSKEQESCLVSHLESQVYTSCSAVVSYVLSQFGVKYTTRGMHKVLMRLGFVYKKTKAIPGKANPEAQEDFVAMYEELLETKDEADPVYFIDGVHAQHNSHPAYGWILRGKEQHIRTNTGRKRVNINGALNAETHEVFIWEDSTINAQSTTALFATLEQQHQDAENIYVILDNAGYYRNRLVTHYVANSKIRLLYLPPYAPNLNLIERLWKFFKKKVSSNRYYEKFRDFKKAVLAFFRNIKNYEQELSTLLVDNFEIVRPDFVI
jgi:transposase